MARTQKPALAFMAAVVALLALTACAQPGRNAPPVRDDTRDNDHADRGMTKSDSM